MSAFTEDFPAKLTQKWRAFASEPAFSAGIDWLRHTQAPKLTGSTPVEKFESAIAWHAYQKALNDVEDRLTQLPVDLTTLDEPPLRS
jgi:hypothetical protein